MHALELSQFAADTSVVRKVRYGFYLNFLNSESESDACNTGKTSSPKPRFGNQNGVNIQGKLIVGDETN